tara:strand:- start:243 stop:674 length:432 start_codon:yes stop_codon:yes gene_type:complete
MVKSLSCLESLFSRSLLDTRTLFVRMLDLIGVQLANSARAQLLADPGSFLFDLSDIAEIYIKAKVLNIIDFSEGMSLYMRGNRTVGRERRRLLSNSAIRFQRAMISNPGSADTLFHWVEDTESFLIVVIDKHSLDMHMSVNFQ